MSGLLKGLITAAALLALLTLGTSTPALAHVDSPGAGVSGTASAPEAPLPLNHFYCYFVSSSPVAVQVKTQDQFDARPKKTLVQNPTYFCNPVKKTHGNKVSNILFPNDHLIVYFTGISNSSKKVNVQVRNQFGVQTLTVFKPSVSLMVPTQKKPLDKPKDTDHFKCYDVDGQPLNETVSLEDQFLQSQVVVTKPTALCNPTRKLHNGVWTEVQHPQAHLVCYEVTQKDFSKTIKTVNQFRREKLSPENPDTLCVPSTKKIVQ